MSTLTITAKGQITLRKELLKHLGAAPGDRVTVEKRSDGRIEVRVARPQGRISDVFGSLKREGGLSLTIEQINDVAAAGWAGER